MKKICAILTAMLMTLLCFTGCTSSVKNTDDGSLNIVTTIFAPYDFARTLTAGIENVGLTMLLSPGMESHSFEPTPQDIITVQNADLFIYVGGESDQWVETILKSVDTSNMTVLTLMDCVELSAEEYTEGMTAEHEHDEHEAEEYDEHVWTSPRNATLICDKIENALTGIAPEHADMIAANAEKYGSELDALDKAFTELFETSERNEIIMGDRFPFLYFAKAYGMEYYAAFPGCAAESEPNPKTLTFLIDKVKEDGIPAVFHMELSNESVADAICEATGAKKLLLHACHNITKEDFDAGETYLTLMYQNLENLREALN